MALGGSCCCLSLASRDQGTAHAVGPCRLESVDQAVTLTSTSAGVDEYTLAQQFDDRQSFLSKCGKMNRKSDERRFLKNPLRGCSLLCRRTWVSAAVISGTSTLLLRMHIDFVCHPPPVHLALSVLSVNSLCARYVSGDKRLFRTLLPEWGTISPTADPRDKAGKWLIFI